MDLSDIDNISFARKYRPTSIDDYVGNADVKETVRRYLRNGRPQSVLLTGNSGCGKTTMARLLAKEYLCEDRDPEKGACGECMSCVAIDEYISTGKNDMLPDIYEIDSTDKSGKKDIDSLLSTIDYPAMGGSWKIYIIDEAHKLSEGAMGRLLKSLEEPPEGVLMIFCTTNPERLLDTIKNRCQLKLQVSKPTMAELVKHLQVVCMKEDREYDLNGLRLIAARANNVIRDSLNLLEQVLTTRGNATGESVSAEFKEVSDKLIFDFFEDYLKKDYMDYIRVLYTIKTTSTFPQFLNTLSSFTVRGIYVINGIDVEGLSGDELLSYARLFRKFSVDDLSYILSSIRKMGYGDIEANFMSFIYNDRGNAKPEEKPKLNIVSDSSQEERHFRNSNLQILEDAKLSKGRSGMVGELESVSFSDVSSEMFNLEKVSSTPETS